MKSAGGGSTENAGERQASYQAGTVPAAGPIPTPVNLTAAANQIQEFLNAFGKILILNSSWLLLSQRVISKVYEFSLSNF